MSKVIDTISNPFKKEKRFSSTQEELANIYLKVSDKKRVKKDKRRSRLPWVVSGAAVCLAAATLLFKSHIDIRISILGEVPTAKSDTAPAFGSVREKGLYLVRGGDVNTYVVRSADFAGDARTFSKLGRGEIILCNSRGSGWANYEINFREPADLSRLDLNYTARGERGEESLTVVLVDGDNKTYRVEKDISSALSQEWKHNTINFGPLKKAIDLTSISKIRFEFGSLTAGNSSVATLYLKDVYLTKARRAWLW